MIRIFVICMIGCVTFLIACSGKTFLLKKDMRLVSDGIVGIEGVWLKDKLNKFDLMVRVVNKTDKPVLISRGNIICGQGSVKGVVHYTSIDNLGQQWLFEPAEKKQFYIICNLGKTVKEEPFYFGLRQVYENLNSDGASRGKPLLNNNVVLEVDATK